jgi:uncharacterized membrane protein YeaQ/YmgE (transglycosylase-associated protein family)
MIMGMDYQTLAVIAVIGIVAGWLAHKIIGGGRWGIISYLLTGLIGAFVGNIVVKQYGNPIPHINFPYIDQVIVAVIGAIIVSLLAKVIA